MDFNKLLSKLFGSKATRDMKLIQPWVEKIKAVSPAIEALTHDELRAKTRELQHNIQSSADDLKQQISEIRAKIEETPIEEREQLFTQIDKLEKQVLERMDVALEEALPEAFAIVKETARRFATNETIKVTATDYDRELAVTKDFVELDEDGVHAIYHNHWLAGGNDLKWEMVHYDVQLFGGVVLTQGKIAEMATGEGKTLVATCPVFLRALSGRGVHVVTVNDYLAKRDSEWMGPLYQFHGLSVDCIDKHQPNSEARRRAYNADITFGTNNEFGFDYLRDNMAMSPSDLVQRKHYYAIVDEVDSVLIDDARTPLIISGPVEKGEDQMYEEYQPLVDRLYQVQRKLATEYLTEAKRLIASDKKEDREKGFLALYRSHKALPKNGPLIKFLSEPGIKAGMLKTEEIYMENNNRRMPEAVEPLYFVVDEKQRSCDLTDKGTAWLAEQVQNDQLFVLPDITGQLSALEASNLSDEERVAKKDELLAEYAVKSDRVHTLQQLLKAYSMFTLNDDYVIQDGQVKIVDESTGRIMEGRRWSDGLHQAVEAKEHVKVEAATQTFATITLQNYFRMYHKLAGMTGTAITEAGEFWNIYKLDVVEIPTNRPIQRNDMNDRVYKTQREKYNAVIEEVERMRNSGRPVLVGTSSVEISELLSRLLKLRHIPHQVLNAKLHQKEADIVALAGQSTPGIVKIKDENGQVREEERLLGAVTIATNMAGRGTDIVLGGNPDIIADINLRERGLDPIETPEEYEAAWDEELEKVKEKAKKEAEKVRKAGGLYVLGTERHESRRIDNQLRGRSGRQGDPGLTRFYLSMRDDLMVRFVGQTMENMMNRLNVPDDVPIEAKMVTNSIKGAQAQVENQNFEMRKNVLKYDEVMNEQRKVIYRERREILESADIAANIQAMIDETITAYVRGATMNGYVEDWDLESLWHALETLYGPSMTVEELIDGTQFGAAGELSADDLLEAVLLDAHTQYEQLEEAVTLIGGEAQMRNLERQVILPILDQKWREHLYEMDYLKEGIGLRAMAQRDPLVEYQKEGGEMFDAMKDAIKEETVRQLFMLRKQFQAQAEAMAAAAEDAQA